MNSSSPQIKEAGQRLVSAVSSGEWARVSEAAFEMLWSLAEARPDFEELPEWISNTLRQSELRDNTGAPLHSLKECRAILELVSDRYGDHNDRATFAAANYTLFKDYKQVSPEDMANFLTKTSFNAIEFRNGNKRLSLAIADNEILVGRHTKISFNRTLRIPEDGREYPLPAGFGRLPILRVEDYANKVPAKWLEEGGFIIPLYQREALFLEFSGVKWRPTIAKVAVGRVNAITGKEYDLNLRAHQQDYLVLPEQRWLDGINSAKGSVSQFVAMPLGQGYTIEAQVTDEEKHGGFQITVFDPKSGRFQGNDPEYAKLARNGFEHRLLSAKKDQLLRQLPVRVRNVVETVQKFHYKKAAILIGISEEDVLKTIKRVDEDFRNALGPEGFSGVIPLANLEDDERSSQIHIPRLPHEMVKRSLPVRYSPASCESSREHFEMGIAAGGKIKQKILEDTYGIDTWDPTINREIILHIVNSAVYQEITGHQAPPSPITTTDYQKSGFRWYSYYDEKVASLSPAAAFKRIFSVGQINKQRRIDNPEPTIQPVDPKQIARIHTPTKEERTVALLKRAEQSVASGNFKIAVRESTLALGLDNLDFRPLVIRAQANQSLARFADAEADATECLRLIAINSAVLDSSTSVLVDFSRTELTTKHSRALSVRAASCLKLGEPLLARNDAEEILKTEPASEFALLLLAEAHIALQNFLESSKFAEQLLKLNPSNIEAIKIRDLAIHGYIKNMGTKS